MENEYSNGYPVQESAPASQPYQAPPACQTPPQPVYEAPAYGAPNGYPQPTAQPPYGNYNQPPAQQPPYGDYSQSPYPAYREPPYGYGQPAYNPYGQPTSPASEPASGSSGVFATLGMVFGIVGLSLCWFPYLNILAFLMSLAGIPFSAIGKKSRSGKAVAGLVTSIIGTVLGFFFLIGYSESGVY